jgi:hypothetical protein
VDEAHRLHHFVLAIHRGQRKRVAEEESGADRWPRHRSVHVSFFKKPSQHHPLLLMSTSAYQRNNWQSMDRGFSGGGGGNRFGGGGGNRFGGSFGNTGFGGGRPARFNEPMNEMMMVPGGRGGSIGGAKQDPRAPPSYRLVFRFHFRHIDIL